MNGEDYLLDTNIIVPFLNGDPEIIKKFRQLSVIKIPFVVLGELYFGAYKSAKIEKNISNLKEFITSHCEVFHASDETLEVYGKVKQSLSKKGKPIPENDIWIAALALENRLPLVTRDRHFIHLSELEIIQW